MSDEKDKELPDDLPYWTQLSELVDIKTLTLPHPPKTRGAVRFEIQLVRRLDGSIETMLARPCDEGGIVYDE